MKRVFPFICIVWFVVSCSSQQRISKSAKENVLNVQGLKNAHIGISIYNEEGKKYLYNYNADKYFVPASNTKIPTTYVAMKYLGDSLPGLKVREFEDRIVVAPTGDPTLLDPEFEKQPVFDFLQKTSKPVFATKDSIKTSAWGSGWSWSDYDADYMPERSSLPVYSNVIWFYGMKNDRPNYFPNTAAGKQFFKIDTKGSGNYLKNVSRELRQNNYTMQLGGSSLKEVRVPFITSTQLQWQLLADTLHKTITLIDDKAIPEKTFIVYSQPTDSMLRILMHRSDNFFAEQSLLMAGNAVLGEMNDSRFIDSVLNSDFKDLPQKPRWVDGSGLSRYNLFTPQDFVAILQKLKSEFGMERIKNIFATGGAGTLSSYYKEENGYIYAKTGTLSGVVALSGFLYTKKNKLLLFSVLVNNHNTYAADVRRAVEKFLKGLRERY